MKNRARLSVRPLEAREVPAQFGIPWASPTALTVSFAPDGADVDGETSELNALMARSGLTPAAWQGQILRAFQSWAAAADLNVGLVTDSGDPLGAAGTEQADPRFGDVRIFAAPLAGSVLAITTPPGDLAGTRTGDIILNSNYHFGIGAGLGRDLYTVVLQEAGHALGIGNSPDTTSAMYEFYQGVRTALSTADVQQVRTLYGTRPTATWEPAGKNDSAPSATVLTGTGTLVSYGDLASTADVDWFTFTPSSTQPLTVELRAAGLSLLAGRAEVYDANMTLVGSAAATGPGQDLSVALAGLTAGAQYFVLVEDATGTAFAAGQYQLRVVGDPAAPQSVTLGGQAPTDDHGTNESALSATVLANTGPAGKPTYRAFATLRAGDADVYRVRAPLPGMNQANVLTATVRAFAAGMEPTITVTSALGLPVDARVEAAGNGLYTVQVDRAAANADYHLTVRGGTGAYELRAGFRSTVTAPYQVDSGLLTILNPTKKGTLEVTGSAQIYFQLNALLTPLIGPSVVVKITDSANRVRFQLLARAGESVDGVALLGPGTYKVTVTGNGGLLPMVASGFNLKTALLTDPIGATPSSGSGSSGPPSAPPSGYRYKNSSGTTTKTESTPTGTGA